MINQLLDELQDTWGYTQEELQDIRDKMETLYYQGYWDGYGEKSEHVEQYYKGFSAYGKHEDIK